ncbi:hypothetical protein AJ80_00901 [Polytolypa hystricis UAMH7299]|uniref:Uncharacterized protein n=1 Tax=Polytolypa hystricis (strain UAMH7299) TaxID=1447883 RepID=A0A2B7Z2H6_POLH7|nr:hypothetical protein AJ80_00901 [Polytolypa hystricis UAMH7299]
MDAAELLGGATSLRAKVLPDRLHAFLESYNDTVGRTFILTTAVACLSSIGCALMEWKKLKKPKSNAEAEITNKKSS